MLFEVVREMVDSTWTQFVFEALFDCQSVSEIELVENGKSALGEVQGHGGVIVAMIETHLGLSFQR